MEHMTTDILIIGAGAAGLRAAADAAASGQRTLVVSKLPPGLGTSTIMSGGAMAGHSQGGSTEGHRNATLAAGRGFNQADLLEVFVAEAPSRLQELVDWGLKSTAKYGGLFSHGKAGALGRGMIDCLWAKAASRGAQSLAGVMVWHISFDRQGGRVLAFHPKRNQWLLIRSKAVVLASGGASALYLYHDNPQRMMGEGYTLALEAGATLQDMEFAQFFPLALAEPGKPLHLFPPSLEVVGSLKNTKGEDIHHKYNLTELPAARKARDKLSQALFREISQGQETFIDLRGVTKEEWCADPFAAELWDQLAVKCKATERKLRITPAAHFFVGGATIDPDCNTSVPGFFICGEAAGGVHGANRMGGNALTETIVFGARAGISARQWAENAPAVEDARPGRDLEALVPPQGGPDQAASAAQLKERLKQTMWQEAGIIRTEESLNRAARELARIKEEADGLGLDQDPRKTPQVLELKLGVRTAQLIVAFALRRQESRGVSFRQDFPEQDDQNWLKRSYVRLNEKSEQEWTFGPA